MSREDAEKRPIRGFISNRRERGAWAHLFSGRNQEFKRVSERKKSLIDISTILSEIPCE